MTGMNNNIICQFILTNEIKFPSVNRHMAKGIYAEGVNLWLI